MSVNYSPAWFFKQLLLISQFEFNRTFATRKGLTNLLTFAVVWYFILMYPIRYAAEVIITGQSVIQASGLFEWLGFEGAGHWQIPEFGVFWHFALLLFPMLSVSLAADQTCSDRERGTLRFIVLRCSRDCLFFGRFTGVMLIQMALISLAGLSVFLLALSRDGTLAASALNSLFIMVVNVTLAIMPFTAMMAVLSAQVKTVRHATVWAILIWTFLAWFISGLAYYFPLLSVFKYLIPGYQLTDLSQLSEWQTLQLAHIPLLQTIVLLGVGRWIMARQAL